MVLESWYGSRRKVQEVSGAIPGNSQLGVAGITNSLEGGYGGPGGLVFHQTLLLLLLLTDEHITIRNKQGAIDLRTTGFLK